MAIVGIVERLTTELPNSLTLRRFSTADYLQMVEVGVLGPEDNVELIGGMIVKMSPAGSRHNHFLGRLNRLFTQILDKGEVWVQGTLRVAEGEVYDPDFMLLRLRLGGYKQQLPAPQDVLLLVEAAESSLRLRSSGKVPHDCAVKIVGARIVVEPKSGSTSAVIMITHVLVRASAAPFNRQC